MRVPGYIGLALITIAVLVAIACSGTKPSTGSDPQRAELERRAQEYDRSVSALATTLGANEKWVNPDWQEEVFTIELQRALLSNGGRIVVRASLIDVVQEGDSYTCKFQTSQSLLDESSSPDIVFELSCTEDQIQRLLPIKRAYVAFGRFGGSELGVAAEIEQVSKLALAIQGYPDSDGETASVELDVSARFVAKGTLIDFVGPSRAYIDATPGSEMDVLR